MGSSSKDTILYRVWLCMTQRLSPSVSHLDGLNWEVFVDIDPDIACPYHLSAKMLLTTSYLMILQFITCFCGNLLNFFYDLICIGDPTTYTFQLATFRDLSFYDGFLVN